MSVVERAVVDIFAGGVAGMVSTVACHPLDTIRTRLQTTTLYAGAWECFKTMVRQEGVRSLYLGLSAPLMAQALFKAIIFTVNSIAITILKGHPQATLTPVETALCGGIAGGVNAFVVTPVELVRNRLMLQRRIVQVKGGSVINVKMTPKAAISQPQKTSQQQLPPSVYLRGPLHCATNVIQNEGVFALWKGNLATCIRDGLGVAVWFLTFNQMRHWMSDGSDSPLPFYKLLIAGAAAGVAFWTVALPADTVKSVISVSSANQEGLKSRTSSPTQPHFNLKKYFALWRVAALRGLPGSGIVLAVHYSLSVFVMEQFVSNKNCLYTTRN
mmetsp:Transcript_19126/g.24121  ORF Transcript_19126/g.24121 Transcript_19126/m.24121 type:complete len:328 (+) Transcript_19126:137-1120(+)